ncbi:platelet glycoprotein VI [Nycticebus coucang]|uniref:platelet glycoprotein VI n=1 Tax=Nycticebus coucang TaxID=9470 RepID=UPI00234DA959|nr:platelet glycoprotein VI [Nycticebus coucang]
MSPSPSTLLCLGLCLGQVRAQSGTLPKPSLQAVPSSLVPLEKPVTIRCQGPPGVDLYRLEKLSSDKYEDQAFLSIPAMRREHAGRYRCSYQNGSLWSPASDQLELVATGVYAKPSLSAQPGPAVSPGGDVTLQCQTPYSFDQFALYKEGDPGPYKRPERWYRASFPLITVTAAHSGTYRCYSFTSSDPYSWSAPSDPLKLVVTGPSVTPSQLPTEHGHTPFPFSSLSLWGMEQLTHKDSLHRRETSTCCVQGSGRGRTEHVVEVGVMLGNRSILGSVAFPRIAEPRPWWEDHRISMHCPVSFSETSRIITTSSPEKPSSPTVPARLQYAKGNLAQICLGAVILMLLVGFLAEDWHSRRRPLLHRVRAVQRPLPSLPQIQKSHSLSNLYLGNHKLKIPSPVHRSCFQIYRGAEPKIPCLSSIVAVLKGPYIYRNKDVDQQVGDPAEKAGEANILQSCIFELPPPPSSRADGDGLKTAQVASRAERKAPGHSVKISDKFTPHISQGVCHSPDKYHLRDPLEEKKEEVGRSQVGEDQVCGPGCPAGAGDEGVGEEKKGVPQDPSPSLDHKQ